MSRKRATIPKKTRELFDEFQIPIEELLKFERHDVITERDIEKAEEEIGRHEILERVNKLTEEWIKSQERASHAKRINYILGFISIILGILAILLYFWR